MFHTVLYLIIAAFKYDNYCGLLLEVEQVLVLIVSIQYIVLDGTWG